MADERRCYAGDLNSDTLGKRVRIDADVTVGPVVEIAHRVNARGVKTTRIISEVEAHRIYDTATVEVTA